VTTAGAAKFPSGAISFQPAAAGNWRRCMVTAYGDDERRRRAGEFGAAEPSPSRSISIG
jgi:hypothetical protein